MSAHPYTGFHVRIAYHRDVLNLSISSKPYNQKYSKAEWGTVPIKVIFFAENLLEQLHLKVIYLWAIITRKEEISYKGITFQEDLSCIPKTTCVDTYPPRICLAFKSTTSLAPVVLQSNKFGPTAPYANLQVCTTWCINGPKVTNSNAIYLLNRVGLFDVVCDWHSRNSDHRQTGACKIPIHTVWMGDVTWTAPPCRT